MITPAPDTLAMSPLAHGGESPSSSFGGPADAAPGNPHSNAQNAGHHSVASKPIRRRWTPVHWTRIGAAIAILAILTVSVFTIGYIYERETTLEKQNLLAFDSLLAEQTSRALEGISLVQDALAEELNHMGLDEPGDMERVAAGHDVYERLQQRLSGLPQLRALVLVATDGHVVNSSRSWPPPQVQVADRAFFKALSPDDTHLRSIVEKTLRTQGPALWNVFLARRLGGVNERFSGLILGALNTDYFTDFYQDLSLPSGTVIRLMREDGTLLLQYPTTLASRALQPPMLSSEALHDEGNHVGIVGEGSLNSLFLMARTRLTDHPIIVTVSRPLKKALADWMMDSEITLVATLIGVISVIAMAHLISHQFRAFQAAANAMAARESVERTLHEAEAKLLQSQKLESLGRLTAGVSHDFNNLLTVIRANAELLQSNDLPPNLQRRISTICQATDRGAMLIQQLLAFARQQLLTPSAVDLNETLDHISELLRTSVAAPIHLDIRRVLGLWQAYADSAQLKQAILNLVMNACDAITDQGTITIETANVTVPPHGAVGQLGPGDYVTVTISDTGRGMNSDVSARAFDPFFTTKPQGQGSGLGLSQVVGFARQSGGDVLLDSFPNKGTQVRILLPRLPTPPSMDFPASFAFNGTNS